MIASESRYRLGWTTLAAKCWGAEGQHKVLAIHGWMDNAASFDRLAPGIHNAQVLAIDTNGHGFSDWLPRGSVYNLWSDLAAIKSLVDQLGWERFSIIGHSRGANVGVLFSATFPHRVNSLTLIDGGHPQTMDDADFATQLARATQDRVDWRKFKPRYFSSRDEALNARLVGTTAITRQAAERLASRGLSNDQRGYFWHADPMLKASSEVRLTPRFLRQCYQSITCPSCIVLAEQGYADGLGKSPLVTDIPDSTVHRLSGSHHLHLEDGYEVVADTINAFVKK